MPSYACFREASTVRSGEADRGHCDSIDLAHSLGEQRHHCLVRTTRCCYWATHKGGPSTLSRPLFH